MGKSKKTLFIGTSGWNYDGWKGDFYPEKIGQARMLEEYAKTFGTVEVNGTFYSLPKAKTVKDWVDRTPRDFCFSVKGSRYITHMKKLKDPREPLDNLNGILEAFGDKLGPVLFQLPPNWNVNIDRLKDFLKALSGDFRYTFEFRDKSWLCQEVYDLLNKHEAALCIYDYEQYLSPEEVTTDFVYLRLHGPEKQAYKGSYKDDVLEDHAGKCRSWVEDGKAVYCYFDNDEKACAPKDAQRMEKLLNASDG